MYSSLGETKTTQIQGEKNLYRQTFFRLPTEVTREFRNKNRERMKNSRRISPPSILWERIKTNLEESEEGNWWWGLNAVRLPRSIWNGFWFSASMLRPPYYFYSNDEHDDSAIWGWLRWPADDCGLLCCWDWNPNYCFCSSIIINLTNHMKKNQIAHKKGFCPKKQKIKKACSKMKSKVFFLLFYFFHLTRLVLGFFLFRNNKYL